MKKFNIGDRVRAIGRIDYKDLTGKVGTVVCYGEGRYDIGVEFDEKINGHSCCIKGKAYGKKGHCWFGKFDEFKPIAPSKKIVITTDGEETLARLYENGKVVKSATAKCSSDDAFEFNTGARLAFDRLIEESKPKEEKPKYYNGKVVCVETRPHWAYTVGKIYEFVDGQLKNDNGYKTPIERISTLDEWHEKCGNFAKLIPLVEETKGE